HVRSSLEDPLAFLLRHASDDGELLSLSRRALKIVEPLENLLLGFIADAARVIQHQSEPACSRCERAYRSPSRSPARSSGIRRSRCKKSFGPRRRGQKFGVRACLHQLRPILTRPFCRPTRSPLPGWRETPPFRPRRTSRAPCSG